MVTIDDVPNETPNKFDVIVGGGGGSFVDDAGDNDDGPTGL